MKSIPSYRSGHLMPYLSFWKELCVPFEKYFRRTKQPSQIVGETELYLPLLPTISCIKNIQNIEGIDEISYRALQHLHFTHLNEQFVSAAFHSPTLLSALIKFSMHVSAENTEVRFWIDFSETDVKLCIDNCLPLEPIGARYQEWGEL